MKERLENVASRIAEASHMANNSVQQYQINRDFGYVQGMLQILDIALVRYWDETQMENLVQCLEKDYPIV